MADASLLKYLRLAVYWSTHSCHRFQPEEPMILYVLIAMVAGWINRHQQQVIAYLHEENRVLKAQLGGHRLRLTDTERRRLAALAHPRGRKRLKEVAAIATPD